MYLQEIYSDNVMLNQRKVCDYLVMDLDYSTDGEVKVPMIKHVKKILDNFSKEIASF